MKKRILIFLLFSHFGIYAQTTSTISGTVENAQGDTLTLVYDPLLLGIKPITQQHIFTSEKSFKFEFDIDKNSIVELRLQKQQIILFLGKGEKLDLAF